MPCVLPVLSIKLLSVVGHVAKLRPVCGPVSCIRRRYRACFLLLGTVAVALQRRPGGRVASSFSNRRSSLSWSHHHAVRLNMWGLFEIHLPGAVSEAAVNASGQGQRYSRAFHVRGIATLLATPYRAVPRHRGRIALSRGAIEICGIFALDWARAAVDRRGAFPLLVNRLPKPGLWMLTLKPFCPSP